MENQLKVVDIMCFNPNVSDLISDLECFYKILSFVLYGSSEFSEEVNNAVIVFWGTIYTLYSAKASFFGTQLVHLH